MRLFSSPVVLYCCIAAAFGCAPSVEGGPGTGGSSATAGTTGGTGSTGSGGTTGVAGTGTGSGGNAPGGSGGSGSGTAGSTGNTGGTGGSGTGGGGTGGSTTGSAGSGSTAGATGTGGRGGGNAGRGGTTGNAGSGGSGTGGSAGGTTGSGGSGTGDCTFTVTPTMSTKIPTVATITWSTTLAGATSAKIDFGLTTTYGMTAPVASVQASNKTYLLGMKAAKMYNYKITAMGSGGASCESQNYTLMTGALASGLMKPTLSPTTATGLSGGFLITGQYQGGAGAGQSAYILDGDGDFVWWYSIGGDVTGARMSYDGNYMWINNANVPNGQARVRRVTMDGMTENNYDSQFSGMNHQIAILPDETVAFYAYGSNGCDDIKERSPSGQVKTVVNSKTALKINDSMCHLNNIQYSKADDSLVFSNLQSSQIGKVKRSDGSTIWIMNGSSATITGVTWTGGNHGIHMIDTNRFFFFNNNNGGSGGSIAVEVMINGNTATKGFTYQANPGVANMVMGDVQKMANGNVVIGYSTRGVLHEVSSSGTKLQTWTWAAGQTFGYLEKRPTLYGPPPR